MRYTVSEFFRFAMRRERYASYTVSDRDRRCRARDRTMNRKDPRDPRAFDTRHLDFVGYTRGPPVSTFELLKYPRADCAPELRR